jgi:hypothetical protein
MYVMDLTKGADSTAYLGMFPLAANTSITKTVEEYI